MTATLINILAPLITISVLTSALGMSVYGIYITFLAKIAVFVVFAELGFGMYLGKEVSVHRGSKRRVSSLFWIFLVTKLVIFFLSIPIFILLSKKFGVVETLLCALIFFQFINVTPILMGLENYKFLTIVQVVTKTLMVVLVLIVDFSTFGLERALIIQVAVAALTTFVLLIYFIKNNKLEKKIPSGGKFKIVLMGSFPFYSAKLFVNLYQQSSAYFVSFVLSSELVAIYYIAIQLYKVGQAVIGSVSRVLYTSTVNSKDFALIRKLTVRSLIIHISFFPVVFFYGDQILSVIFSFDVAVLVNLSIFFYISLFSVILSSYWGYPALTAIGKENYAHIGILVSSITYFLAFGFLVMLNSNSIYLMVGCIILADFMGMLVRLFFARKFKLL
jgi:O-antigen/teichoic acid export membrane protein